MDPFVGEIRLFAGTYAPMGWAFCDGQLLSVNAYQVLYALIGATYGGNGSTTFAVPDLRGRVPVSQGAGPGLTPRGLAQTFGTENVTLTPDQIPHSHTLMASTNAPSASNPTGAVLGTLPVGSSAPSFLYSDGTAAPAPLNTATVSPAPGGVANQPHSNVMPFQVINYIIALEGVFPQMP